MPLNENQRGHLEDSIVGKYEGAALREQLSTFERILNVRMADVVGHLQAQLQILREKPEDFNLIIEDYEQALQEAIGLQANAPRPAPGRQQTPPVQPRGPAIYVQGSLECERPYGALKAGQVYTTARMRQTMSDSAVRYTAMPTPLDQSGCLIQDYLNVQDKHWIKLDCTDLPARRLVYVAYNQRGRTCQGSACFNADGSVVLRDSPSIVPVTRQGQDLTRGCIYTKGIDGGCTALCLIYWSNAESRYTRASIAHISGGDTNHHGFNIADLLEGMDERDQVWGVLGINRLTTDTTTEAGVGVDAVTIPVLEVLNAERVNTLQITIYQSYPRGGFSLGIDSNGRWGEVPDAPTS